MIPKRTSPNSNVKVPTIDINRPWLFKKSKFEQTKISTSVPKDK